LRLNLFWLAVACCVVAQFEILRFALKTARASNSSVPTPSRWSEVLWTLVPAVGLAVVLAFTWHAIASHRPTASLGPAPQTSVIVEHPS